MADYLNSAGKDLGVFRVSEGKYNVGGRDFVFMKKRDGLYMKRGPGVINAHEFLDYHFIKITMNECLPTEDEIYDKIGDGLRGLMRSSTMSGGKMGGLLNQLTKQKTMVAAKQQALSKQKTMNPSKTNQFKRTQTLMGGITGPKKSLDSLLDETPVRSSDIN
jgi:hypothetical protein